MEEGKLSLNHYLQLCLDFTDNPSVDNESKLKAFLGGITIKDYMPMKDKMVCSAHVLLQMDKDFDAVGGAAMLEINKVLYGLLCYATNLENDIGILNQTYVVYDYCVQFGLVDVILNVCSKDYAKLSAQIDSMIHISNTYKLVETAALFNQADYEKLIITLNELKDTLTPELLKDLEVLSSANGGPSSDLAKILAQASVDATIKHSMDEAAKIESIADHMQETQQVADEAKKEV